MTTRSHYLLRLLLGLAPMLVMTSHAQEQAMNLGIPVNEQALRSIDLIAPPDGSGFPEGSGTAMQGQQVFNTYCVACHAVDGTGTSGSTVLVGGNMQSTDAPLRTVGSYWPHASTLFDYIRRAMPANNPKALTDTQVYQLVAYVLFLNGLVDEDQVIDKAALMQLKMPNAEGFIDHSHLQ